ncbi:hypothetical protein GQ53DRAFT_31280 [Thozetella sp. PMI_491]|nr:hypothetical protein GQ53DRAFT_31280 [Thozetella sp. PMI_491]
MVSAKSLALATLASLPSTMGYIASMKAPATASPGQTIQVTLTDSIYIQNWDDFGIIWGIQNPTYMCDGCIGTRIGWTNLFGDGATTEPPSGDWTVDVTIPETQPTGNFVLNAAVPYLVGASGVTDIKVLNASITIA